MHLHQHGGSPGNRLFVIARVGAIGGAHLAQAATGPYALPEQEIHAVFPSPKLVPTKVQAFVAFLQGQFGGRWWETLPKA